MAVDLLEASRERRSLIHRLEVASRQYLPLSGRMYPGNLEQLDKLILVMAEVSEFNHAFPHLAIPKMIAGKVPVPELGAPLSDTNRPVPT